MNLIAAWPRMMRRDIAQEYVGGETMLKELEEKKLVGPVVHRNRLTLYDRRELDAACDGLKSSRVSREAPRFLNCSQLAKAMEVPPVFVTAMKSRGYKFPYQHQTTLDHALKWREENPQFRYSAYVDEHRKTPKKLPPSRVRKG